MKKDKTLFILINLIFLIGAILIIWGIIDSTTNGDISNIVIGISLLAVSISLGSISKNKEKEEDKEKPE